MNLYLKNVLFFLIINVFKLTSLQNSNNIWNINNLIEFIENNLTNYKEKYILFDPDNLINLDDKNYLNDNIKEIFKKYSLSLYILFINKFEKNDLSSIDDNYFFELSLKLYNTINQFINNNNSIFCFFAIKNEKISLYSDIYEQNFYTKEKLEKIEKNVFLNFILKKYNKLFEQLIIEFNQLGEYSYREYINNIDENDDKNLFKEDDNQKNNENEKNENKTTEIIPNNIEKNKKNKFPNIYNKNDFKINLIFIILLSIIIVILLIMVIRLCKKIKDMSYGMTNYSVFDEKNQKL